MRICFRAPLWVLPLLLSVVVVSATLLAAPAPPTCSVTVEEIGDEPAAVLDVLQEELDLGPEVAAASVSAPPATVASGLQKAVATALRDALDAAGATAVMSCSEVVPSRRRVTGALIGGSVVAAGVVIADDGDDPAACRLR